MARFEEFSVFVKVQGEQIAEKGRELHVVPISLKARKLIVEYGRLKQDFGESIATDAWTQAFREAGMRPSEIVTLWDRQKEIRDKTWRRDDNDC